MSSAAAHHVPRSLCFQPSCGAQAFLSRCCESIVQQATPSDAVPPVCHFTSECTVCDASAHQHISPDPSAANASGRSTHRCLTTLAPIATSLCTLLNTDHAFIFLRTPQTLLQESIALARAAKHHADVQSTTRRRSAEDEDDKDMMMMCVC